jgi:lysyl-tRNA synthetase class 2
MKRLLAAGAPDIWQLCKVFRDGEAGRRHEPEFTMVEWYRRGFTLDQLARETCALLSHLAGSVGAATATPVYWTYTALFKDALGLDPLTADCAALKECGRRALGPGAVASLDSSLGSERSLWLDLLMSHAISRYLANTSIAVVTGYPADQAALARLDPDDQRLAERFEVFCQGIEVANGYRELTDAAEQRRRFEADRQFRNRLGRPDVMPDPRFLEAIEAGLPDCAGVAVGFDRVVMLLLGLPALQDAISFPVLES